ncbi:MAG: PQQ-binding-like beta-propeller repeat protein [Isosphaeraceae bacterium]
MIRLTRWFNVARTMILATVLCCLVPRQPPALAGDETKGNQAVPAAAPARADGKSPVVWLARGGARRTGAVSGSHLPDHPVVRWTRRLASSPGEPLLANGMIYVGDSAGTLFAIRLTDGSIRWHSPLGGQIAEAPAKRGSTLYVTSGGGLHALRDDGTLLWKCEHVGSAIESSPLIESDRIVVADYDGKVTAVDFDGKLIWQHDIAADAPPSPPGFDGDRARITGTAARPRTAASDGTAVFLPIFDQSRLAVIDLKRGGRRWSFQAKGWIYGEPTLSDDSVFFGSQDNHLYCLDRRRKTFRWSFPTKSRIEAGAAYRDGSVYFGSCDGRFYRVDARTGKEVWSFRAPDVPGDVVRAIYSAPLCTEDAVYFGSFDGFLYCLKIADGAMKWRIEPVKGAEISSALVTDGRQIVVAVRQRKKGEGQDAIVAIGELEHRRIGTNH